MKSARVPQTLLLALLASAAVWAAPAAEPRSGAAPAAVSGVYAVNFNVRMDSAAPGGTVISCRARIAPNLSPLESNQRGMAQAVTVEGLAAVNGSSANCLVEIPFSWTGINRGNGVALSYEVVALSGGVATVRRQQGIGVGYPATGGAAQLRLDVAF